MANVLIMLAALAQAAFVAPASPPPPAAPESEAFKRDQARIEDSLRRSCLSEEGVRIVLGDWTRKRIANASDSTSSDIQRELAEAAYSDPVDMNRLEKALRANAQARADRERELAEDGIAVLRRLSPSDRAIYARQFIWMQPTAPPKICDVTRPH